MLHLDIPGKELFDEETNEFITIKPTTIALEHSLVSLAKWESKWCKPFLTREDKTREEICDYIKQMTITQNVPDYVYQTLSKDVINKVMEYIDAPMTATTIRESPESKHNSRKIVTAEIIYYWMISLQIPFECQKWHLNRLLMLIRVCSEKNSSAGKKRSTREIMNENAALNAARRKSLHSKG